MEYLIDAYKDPFVPVGLCLLDHRRRGNQWNPCTKWDLSKIWLYQSKRQSGKYGRNEGERVLEAIELYVSLNANYLDYLLAHPEIIPEKWDQKFQFGTEFVNSHLFFADTIYADVDDLEKKFIRCLYRDQGVWKGSFRWIGHEFRCSDWILMD